MAASTPWVHQYTLRELLDDTFDLFRERAAPLLLAGAVPYLAIVAYTALMRAYVIPGNFLQEFTPDAFQQMLASWRLWVYLGGLSLVSATVGAAGYLAQCRIAVLHALGHPVSTRAAFRPLVGPVLSLFVVAFLSGIFAGAVVSVVAMFVGVVFMVLFGALAMGSGGAAPLAVTLGVVLYLVYIAIVMMATVVVYTCFLAAPVALAAERIGPFTAIGAGFRAATSNFKTHAIAFYAMLHIPLTVAPLALLVAALLSSASSQVSPTATLILPSLLSGIGTVVLLAVLACFQALVYLDGRCRRDALDLVMVARDVGMGEEIEQAFLRTPAAQPATYPDYAAPSALAAAAAPGHAAVLTPPAPSPEFPNYAAPPPSEPAQPEGEDAG